MEPMSTWAACDPCEFPAVCCSAVQVAVVRVVQGRRRLKAPDSQPLNFLVFHFPCMGMERCQRRRQGKEETSPSVNVEVWISRGSKESRRDILALESIEAWCLALPQASFGGSIDSAHCKGPGRNKIPTVSGRDIVLYT